ncbi:MAG: gyrase subunit, partial [Alphaproteobacteria bacterium]|nr:gyrase subunit [Alphaproteobacteria bacterium]
VNDRNGGVVASFPVNSKDQIMLVTDSGQLIRCPVHDIRIAGRRTQGVTIFRVGEEEKVVAVSRIPLSENDDDVEGDGNTPTVEAFMDPPVENTEPTPLLEA